ncbi:MAG: divergent PAP2 family protein [Clostridia bacterium]|nr:divergent PAP2 family protein [Clostridia bacterium]
MLGILENGILLCALLAWFAAQFLKIPITKAVGGKWEWSRFWSAGGMPSSHSAMVVALSLKVGFDLGFDTPLFAACFVLSAIVMYDAAGVRRETGRQGQVINQILHSAIFEGRPITNEEMKEIVGHTPLEVFGGFLVGTVCAVLCSL